MIVLYVVGALAIIQGLISLIDGYRAAHHMRTFRPRSMRTDRVIVFCPCKGVDHGFEENVRSLLSQDYPNYEIQFIVESRTDSAYQALTALGITGILVAGRTTSRGQKVQNLAFAVATASADIYAFCDSDARYPKYWLSTLVAALDWYDSGCVASGYRWYVVERFNLPTLLRSAWNASVLSMLRDHDRNFAWGGSTALRRETFERMEVLEAWEGAVSDDYAVTHAAQRAKVPVVFVPECLVPSHGECTWLELLEFTTRQIIITRVYHRRLWATAFAGAVIFNTAFWGSLYPLPQIAGILFVLAAWKAAVRLVAVQTVVPDSSLLKFFWFYILSPPFAAVLYLYNMIRSATGTDIVWRQIRYKLISPNKTVVVGDSGANES